MFYRRIGYFLLSYRWLYAETLFILTVHTKIDTQWSKNKRTMQM